MLPQGLPDLAGTLNNLVVSSVLGDDTISFDADSEEFENFPGSADSAVDNLIKHVPRLEFRDVSLTEVLAADTWSTDQIEAMKKLHSDSTSAVDNYTGKLYISMIVTDRTNDREHMSSVGMVFFHPEREIPGKIKSRVHTGQIAFYPNGQKPHTSEEKPLPLVKYKVGKDILRDFVPVNFVSGKTYLFDGGSFLKRYTSGTYSRNFPTLVGADRIYSLLVPVFTFRSSGMAGHVSDELGLSVVDMLNFMHTYPGVKKDIIGASSGLYETLLETVVMVPALMTRKVRAAILAGTKLAKFAKGYLAWELAISPAYQSILDSMSIDLEEMQTFTRRGFSVYRAVLSKDEDIPYDVVPLDDQKITSWFLEAVRHKDASKAAAGLSKPPAFVTDICNFDEDTFIVSDYSITLHIGDILSMSLERKYIMKYGGHLATLAWDLSPISFFTDWWSHVYKSLVADLDLASMEHLYRGTYSNKLTVIQPEISGIAPAQVTSIFQRKMFDPITVPASSFERAFRKWDDEQTLWRFSIFAAIAFASQKLPKKVWSETLLLWKNQQLRSKNVS